MAAGAVCGDYVLMAKEPHHPAAIIVAESAQQHRKLSRQHLHRATAVIDAIAREAELRGMTVGSASDRRGGVVLLLDLGGRVYEVAIRESGDYYSTPMGRLQLWLLGPGFDWAGVHYHDTKTIPMVARVPKLFDDIDAAQPVHDRQEELWREAAERRAAEQAEREERQRIARIESARETLLLETHTRWVRARDLREYSDSLTARLDGLGGARLEEATGWLKWVAEYIERIDPVNDRIKLPGEQPPE